MVVNKDTKNSGFAQDFLVYLSSKKGQAKISEAYPYYLPAQIIVEADLLERKIYPDYNVVYKNFISDDTQLISFDVGDNILYKEYLYDILEMSS
jgi:spermidine/putrescine-binding protein